MSTRHTSLYPYRDEQEGRQLSLIRAQIEVLQRDARHVVYAERQHHGEQL